MTYFHQQNYYNPLIASRKEISFKFWSISLPWLSAWHVIAKYEFGCNWFHFNAKYDSPQCSHKRQLTSVMWLAPSTALKVSKEEGYRNRVKRIWKVSGHIDHRQGMEKSERNRGSDKEKGREGSRKMYLNMQQESEHRIKSRGLGQK